MSAVNKDHFIPSFPIQVLYLPSCLTALAKTLSTMLSRSDENRYLGGNILQYSCLENPMDGGAWWAAVHGVAKSRTRLSFSLSLLTFMHGRRKWQPPPVFLPGDSQGRGSLVGCRLWGRTESDTTEAT